MVKEHSTLEEFCRSSVVQEIQDQKSMDIVEVFPELHKE